MLRAIFFVFALGFQLNSFAQAQSWTSGQTADKTARWASTLNDSSGALTQRCDIEEEQCFWSISILTKCEKDAVFPVLISADAGAWHMSILCGSPFKSGTETYYPYFFSEFDEFDKLVRSSKSIGIAMALKSGQFRVIRFLLDDAVKTIDSMRSLAAVDIEKKKKRSTKDKVL